MSPTRLPTCPGYLRTSTVPTYVLYYGLSFSRPSLPVSMRQQQFDFTGGRFLREEENSNSFALVRGEEGGFKNVERSTALTTTRKKKKYIFAYKK